jgi:VWFA-related protein
MARIFCVLLVFFCGPAFAQDTEVTITNVSVWVRATDKSGKPATGLQQSDFQIFEDGKAVTQTCFEEANFPLEAPQIQTEPPASSESQPVADANRKQIVFVMDLYNTSQAEFLHLKSKANEFLQQISKNWDISLISMLPGLLHVDVENSQDGKAIQEALDKMSANLQRDIDSLKNRRDLGVALAAARGMPRKDPRIINELCGRAREYAILEKKMSFDWMNTLKQLDHYIQKQPEGTHKVVLLFSGGISSNPGKPYFDLIRESPVMAEYVTDERDIQMEFPSCDDEGGRDLQKELKKLVSYLNRYNMTLYTVSSRGPINAMLDTVRERDARITREDLDFLKDYQDFLALMADETGGVYFGNSLNFKRGFDQILTDLNHQYLICYKPPEHPEAGHHEIKVKMKKSGIKVRYREGYYD